MISWLHIDLQEPLRGTRVSLAAPTLVSHNRSIPGTEAAIHLDPPSQEPYHFAQPMTDMHRSQFGQDKALEPLLSQIKNGFFVESGAHDGEAISNTDCLLRVTWLARFADRTQQPLCLYSSQTPKGLGVQWCAVSKWQITTTEFPARWCAGHADRTSSTTVQAEPLAKLLAAIDPARTTVDFWSLDIEGNECDVLRTTDFQKITVGVFLIEMNKSEENNACIESVMKSNGFQDLGRLVIDNVFVNRAYFQERGLVIPKLTNEIFKMY